ncbi:MAG: RNA 3'-terminal phosphate cyclase, partial [Armatimonadetes bacterium]|nr:RNA 3'-terminal phosphate cyclase [Armatimonadota bacterium]
DGSSGEGGGQIVRTSVSLAAMTGRSVEIHNVRGRRTKPGLQPQHLAAVRAAASLCGAQLSGDSVGSQFLRFDPQAPIVAGDYHFDIGTAGAAPLVVQTVLMPLAMCVGASSVRVTGGTHVPHSPPVEYLEGVYVPMLKKAGLDIELTYSSAGFYPRGGGEIQVQIGGTGSIASLDLRERGALKELRAFIVTSNLPEHVAQRGADTVERAMRAIGRKVIIENRAKPSSGPGAAVVVTAQCEAGYAGFSSVGELRKPMEKVAEAPCQEYLRWWKSGASCDEHLADQLVLPMAFASGPSRWTTPAVTEHLRTVMWVVQQFLDVEVNVEEIEGGGGLITMSPRMNTVPI